MTMAPDLSFRGAKRRGNLVQAVTNPPGPSYDAAVYREIAPQGHFPALRAQGATAPAEPRNDKLGSAFFPCHCEEGASPTWQSQAGSDESAGGFPVFRPVLRDCRALLRKARNDKLGCLSHSEGRSAELASAALPCHSEERSDVGISCRHLRIRQGPAVPALTAVYRITKPGHVLRRVPVLCAYCSAYFFV